MLDDLNRQQGGSTNDRSGDQTTDNREPSPSLWSRHIIGGAEFRSPGMRPDALAPDEGATAVDDQNLDVRHLAAGAEFNAILQRAKTLVEGSRMVPKFYSESTIVSPQHSDSSKLPLLCFAAGTGEDDLSDSNKQRAIDAAEAAERSPFYDEPQTRESITKARRAIQASIRRGSGLDLKGIEEVMTEIAANKCSHDKVAKLTDLVQIHTIHPERVADLAAVSKRDREFIAGFKRLNDYCDTLNDRLLGLADGQTVEALQQRLAKDLGSPHLTADRIGQLIKVIDALAKRDKRFPGTDGQERIACLSDIIDSTRKNKHLNIPLDKLLDAPIENLRFIRNRISEAADSFHEPDHHASKEVSFQYKASKAAMLACSQHRIDGDTWIFIPSGLESHANVLRIHGTMISPVTGQLIPVEWAREHPAGDRVRENSSTRFRCKPAPQMIEDVVTSSQAASMADYLQENLKRKVYDGAKVVDNPQRLRRMLLADFGDDKVPFPSMRCETAPGIPSMTNRLLAFAGGLERMQGRNSDSVELIRCLRDLARMEAPRADVQMNAQRLLSEGLRLSSPLQGSMKLEPSRTPVVEEGGRKFVEFKVHGDAISERGNLSEKTGYHSMIRAIRLYSDGSVEALGTHNYVNEFTRAGEIMRPWDKPLRLGHISRLAEPLLGQIGRLPDPASRKAALKSFDELRDVNAENPIELNKMKTLHPAVAAIGEAVERIDRQQRALLELQVRDHLVRDHVRMTDAQVRICVARVEQSIERSGSSVEAAVGAVDPAEFYHETMNADWDYATARKYARIRWSEQVNRQEPSIKHDEALKVMQFENDLDIAHPNKTPHPRNPHTLQRAANIFELHKGLTAQQAYECAGRTEELEKKYLLANEPTAQHAAILERIWGLKEIDAMSTAAALAHVDMRDATLVEMWAIYHGSRGKSLGTTELQQLADKVWLRRRAPTVPGLDELDELLELTRAPQAESFESAIDAERVKEFVLKLSSKQREDLLERLREEQRTYEARKDERHTSLFRQHSELVEKTIQENKLGASKERSAAHLGVGVGALIIGDWLLEAYCEATKMPSTRRNTNARNGQ